MSQLKSYSPALVIFIIIMITSCGQTGDLYLPEADPQQQTQQQSEN